MTDIETRYKTRATTFGRTMIEIQGVGFKIPEYQRTYSWTEVDLNRLVDDCLDGLHQLSDMKNDRIPFTFLGTIVLVKEENNKEPFFNGASFALVDGQQRVTSLVLLCCALYESLKILKNSIIYSGLQNTPDYVKEWLENEIDHFSDYLGKCAVGTLERMHHESTYFPRIIRSGDSRGYGTHAEYRSSISKFLMLFLDYVRDQKPNEFSPHLPKNGNGNSTEFESLLNSYKIIRNRLKVLYDANSQSSDIGLVNKSKFEEKRTNNLFKKLSLLETDDESKKVQKALSFLSTSSETEGLVRTILFSAYMLDYVVLTIVQTDDEESAFDIFDSLNTTGIPLTALETLKPLTVAVEENIAKNKFIGSNSYWSFDRIKQKLDDVREFRVNTEKRQKATRELVTSFALYMDGNKLPLHLRNQRKYLRDHFHKFNDVENKRKYIDSIADLAEFRYEFWIREGECGSNLKLKTDNSDQDTQLCQLCIALLRDMGMNLTVPIIARYWRCIFKKIDAQNSNHAEFFAAVKAITAYVVLRRTYTGGTERIDTELRQIMSKNPHLDFPPLHCGVKFSDQVWSVKKLQEVLRHKLAKYICGQSKLEHDIWLDRAKEVPLYLHNHNICRFLLLAAGHLSISENGKLTREGVIIDDDKRYLTLSVWNDPKFETIEHIAPKDITDNWDTRIYSRQKQHTIGNLTLLPLPENSSVSNKNWEKKKLFYEVCSAVTEIELDKILKKARKQGIPISDATIRFLKDPDRKRLSMLVPIASADEWNADWIEERSLNILQLAWDIIAPWLEIRK